MNHPTIRVLVVDDHVIVRRGVESLLLGLEDIELVGEASHGREALARVEELQPDVILMDLAMPEMGGVETIRALRAADPDVRVLILTGAASEEETLRAVRAGALGYLSKECDQASCAEAIRRVYRRELSLPADLTMQLMQHGDWREPSTERLTPREITVLGLVAQGYDDVEIAEHLAVSKATVRTHVSNLLAKLQLKNRVEATLYALRHGLATLERDHYVTVST